MRSGLWVDPEEAWARAGGRSPGFTCERCLGASGGTRRDFMLACPWAAASLISCEVRSDRWVQPHIAVLAAVASGRWSYTISQSVRHTPVWPACWLPCIDESRESKSKSEDAWEIYEDRLRFMSAREVKVLEDATRCRHFCTAREAWSSAAEGTLVDDHCNADGPISLKILLGRGERHVLKASSWWSHGSEN